MTLPEEYGFCDDTRPDSAGGPQAPGAPDALPCQDSDNSIKPDSLSASQKKVAYALRENVRLVAERYGIERLGFLTLTFADHVLDIREAQRRFNSLRTNVITPRYQEHIAIVERQKSGRIHFHLLVVCSEDIRDGLIWDQIQRGLYVSANRPLRREWAFWLKTAPSYGFGRTEMLPIRSSAEGISRYLGKYISKHIGQRKEADKGARLVRYSKGTNRVCSRFTFHSVGS